MNERECMEYIQQLQGSGIMPGLERVAELCRRLGNPQDQLRFVHIAGTNGKGSAVAYISTVLQSAGFRVGRYISPTIREYRERIQVGGRNIGAAAFCRLLGEVKTAIEGMEADGLGSPSAFEAETALGFLYFVEKKCDYVVLETGMGGLLDATNLVTTTELVVLTSISMDHMQYLGNSLAEIAENKCGIMKQGVPVVSCAQQPEALEVIRAKALACGAELSVVNPEEITGVKYGLDKQRFSYRGMKNLEIHLAGKVQVENAALSVLAAEVLLRDSRKKESAIREGLALAKWDGRFTVIRKKPLFVIDGAHNEDAARRLAESVSFYFTNKKIVYIMGMFRDKEVSKVLELTAPLADYIFTVTSPDNPRSLSAHELAVIANDYHRAVTECGSLEEAVEMATMIAGKDGVVLAFGTLSFEGRIMEIVGYDGSK